MFYESRSMVDTTGDILKVKWRRGRELMGYDRHGTSLRIRTLRVEGTLG